MDILKSKTCIASAWFYTFASGYAVTAPFEGTHRIGILASVFAIGIASAFGKHYFLRVKDNSKESDPPVFETPPASLSQMYRDLQIDMNVFHPFPLRYFSGGRETAYYNPFSGNIAMSKKLYKLLSHDERQYVMAHELAHAAHQDGDKHFPVRLPIFTSLGIAPFMPFAAATMAAGGGPLAMTFAAVGGAVLGTLGAAFTKAAGQYAYRLSEYRADRKSVMTMRNPVAAISALSKIASQTTLQQGWAKSLWLWIQSDINDHPSRNHRIIRIAQDFSAACPRRPIDLYYPRTLFGKVGRSPVLYIDSSAFDGRRYRVFEKGFHVTDGTMDNLTKIEFRAGQPRPNPL